MSYRASLSMQKVSSVFSTSWWTERVALYGSTTVSDTCQVLNMCNYMRKALTYKCVILLARITFAYMKLPLDYGLHTARAWAAVSSIASWATSLPLGTCDFQASAEQKKKTILYRSTWNFAHLIMSVWSPNVPKMLRTGWLDAAPQVGELNAVVRFCINTSSTFLHTIERWTDPHVR